jgi:hypothetical protein
MMFGTKWWTRSCDVQKLDHASEKTPAHVTPLLTFHSRDPVSIIITIPSFISKHQDLKATRSD